MQYERTLPRKRTLSRRLPRKLMTVFIEEMGIGGRERVEQEERMGEWDPSISH